MNDDFVIAVVATYHRPTELRRLLESLNADRDGLGGVVVVDNGGADEINELVAAFSEVAVYATPGSNLGCGGGLSFGIRFARERWGDKVTHYWIMDDDVAFEPGALRALLNGVQEASAEAGIPAILNGDGSRTYVGLRDPRKCRFFATHSNLGDFVRQFGSEPVPFTWCTGISLLFTRQIFDELGGHRSDFWIRGEDLEFALRITHGRQAVMVPNSVVLHLPPSGGNYSPAQEFWKHAAMVQNVVYMATRLGHARSLLRKIPGRFYWLIRERRSVRGLIEAFWAFWLGGVLGMPAGHPQGTRFRTKWLETRAHEAGNAAAK